ncbi:MAG: ribulose-phosphate 3-epimerase [Ruminococcaceae bacterium]|nr:ribulose-phosphate 3-epimerase [Oscillospiraceae bacterium]
MLRQQIAPSMMCADYRTFAQLLHTFENEKIEYLHIDVMDGVFVKNFTLGTDFCRRLRDMTDIPLDIHLMITEPEWKIDWFAPRPGEYVSVHAEATDHLQRALAKIRDSGARPMAALNPATPLSVLDYVLDDIDAVLLMTVNPGFAGQKLIPQTLKKITDCRKYLDERGYSHVEIEVDGNVSFVNAAKMADAGANIYVAGSSSVFCGDDIAGNIEKLRESIGG